MYMVEWSLRPARWIFPASREPGFGEPEGEAGHDDPEDGDLVQELPEQAQGRVEVGRTRSNYYQEHPYYVDPWDKSRSIEDYRSPFPHTLE